MTAQTVTWLVMIFGGVVGAILLFIVLRFVVLWYWRIDEIVARLEDVVRHVKEASKNSKDLLRVAKMAERRERGMAPDEKQKQLEAVTLQDK